MSLPSLRLPSRSPLHAFDGTSFTWLIKTASSFRDGCGPQDSRDPGSGSYAGNTKRESSPGSKTQASRVIGQRTILTLTDSANSRDDVKMSIAHASPPDIAYLVATPFDMPRERGSVWVVAFPNHISQFIIAGLAVVFTLIFPWIWDILCYVAVCATNIPTRRRAVALVMLRNSGGPWSSFKELVFYTYDCFGSLSGTKPGHAGVWLDLLYGLTFSLISFTIYQASIVMGIIGPSFVQVGNVAPVRPSMLFFAEPPLDFLDQVASNVKAATLPPSTASRSLSAVEIAGLTVRPKVNFSHSFWWNYRPMYNLSYSYEVTGVDLGLQHTPDLRLAVAGSCRTEYDWLWEEAAWDLYRVWDLFNTSVTLAGENEFVYSAPAAEFYVHPDQALGGGNVSYAIVVTAAHRQSLTKSTDPWYLTGTAPVAKHLQRVERGRPPLSCWQKDTWSYGTQTVNSVNDLKNVPGLKVPKVLLDVLEAAFAIPMIKTVGTASGTSVLKCGSTGGAAAWGSINAEQCSIHEE